MSFKTKMLIFLALLSLAGVIVLYVLEFQWFQNYLSPKKMVIGSLLLGVLIGLLLGFRFQKHGEELVDKIQIWSVCLVVSMLPMPLLASLANRLFAERETNETQVAFWDQKANLSNIYGYIKGEPKANLGYYIFVIMDGEIVRLKSMEPRFPNAVQGDRVSVPVRRGLLGANFVDWQAEEGSN